MEQTKKAGDNRMMSEGEVDEDDDGCMPEGFAVKVRLVY